MIFYFTFSEFLGISTQKSGQTESSIDSILDLLAEDEEDYETPDENLPQRSRLQHILDGFPSVQALDVNPPARKERFSIKGHCYR